MSPPHGDEELLLVVAAIRVAAELGQPVFQNNQIEGDVLVAEGLFEVFQFVFPEVLDD